MQEFTAMNDRFGTLGEQLAYHILSFLNIEDLGRLMLVSKRCNSLCVSVPCLTVDNRNYTHNLISIQRFNQFVDKFLALRSNSGITTLHFTLFWSFQGSRCDQNKKRKNEYNFSQTEEGLVGKWLSQYLSFRGAERLSINMVPQEGKPNYFPGYIFRSKSVKDLIFCSNNFVLEFSLSSTYLPKLESLTLQSSRISDKAFNEVIGGLHSLKSLYLYDCTGLKGIRIILFKLGHLPAQLDAFRNLAIDYCFLTDDQVPIIASFLKTISCLETFALTSSTTTVHGSCKDGNLKVGVPPEGLGFNVEYWEIQELRFIDQLRVATVEVHREEGNDMELIKYLLKHARSLEYLTIVCAPSLALSVPGRLNSLMKASTKLTFCLKPQTDVCN
ncbi:hypothetical protein REPUB_Repub01dG0223800 [Reevesia pubescens]